MGGELYGGSGSGGEVCADVMLRRQAGLQVYRMYAMLIDSLEELTPIRGWNPFRCRCQRLTSLTNCNAVLPPARDPRPHPQPSTRRADYARSMLRCLQIVDPADAETPLCLRGNLRPRIAHRTVEKGVPGSCQPSRSPHTQSLHSRPFARHRC